MANDIYKITKNGKTIYPGTLTDSVVHPGLKTPLSKMINGYNISSLFETNGINGTNKYTLDSAITLLDSKLRDEENIKGLLLYLLIIRHLN